MPRDNRKSPSDNEISVEGLTPLETLPPPWPPGGDMNAEPDWVDPAELEEYRVLTPSEAYAPQRSVPIEPEPVEDASRPAFSQSFVDKQQKRGEKSINPAGRPPGIPNPRAFLRRMRSTRMMNTPSGPQKMRLIEAVHYSLANQAARGRHQAIKLLEKEEAREARLAVEAEEEALHEANKSDSDRYIEQEQQKIEKQRAFGDAVYELIYPPKYRDLVDMFRRLEELGVVKATGIFSYELMPGMAELFPIADPEK